MRVVDVISQNTRRGQQLVQDFSMTLGSHRNPAWFASEPTLYLSPRDGGHRRLPIEPGICDHAQESSDAFPRKANRRHACELTIEPFPGQRVMRRSGIERIDQQIRIKQNHLNCSPSAIASASLTETTSPMRQRPSETGCVRDSLRGLAGAASSFNPRRSAVFISSLRLLSPVRRRLSSAAATSVSSVKVVRMHQNIIGMMS